MSRGKDGREPEETGPLRNLGATMVLLRRLADKNQSEFARDAGFGKAQLSAYEYGYQIPTMKTFERILKVLQVSPLGFFFVMHQIDRMVEDLRANAKPRSRPLTGEAGPEDERILQSVAAELLRLLRAARRKQRDGG